MTFDEAIAADTLGVLLPEQLPQVATQALCSGIDSPLLAALAGESPRAALPDELHSLFERTLHELGIERPAPIQAAETLRNYYARRVVAGEISPQFGAGAIVHGVLERVREHLPPGEYLGDGLGIARLVGVFYDYDLVCEGLATKKELDGAVLEECERILAMPAA